VGIARASELEISWSVMAFALSVVMACDEMALQAGKRAHCEPACCEGPSLGQDMELLHPAGAKQARLKLQQAARLDIRPSQAPLAAQLSRQPAWGLEGSIRSVPPLAHMTQ
jgi:hypothetical protein